MSNKSNKSKHDWLTVHRILWPELAYDFISDRVSKKFKYSNRLGFTLVMSYFDLYERLPMPTENSRLETQQRAWAISALFFNEIGEEVAKLMVDMEPSKN